MASKKAGWLSIFCGIWSMVMGSLFCYAFIFCSFDMGSEGYAKVGKLYKEIASNISWIATCLGIVGIISCLLLIVGGIMLILNSKNRAVSIFGLWGVYFYFLCYVAMAFLLAISGGNLGLASVWIGAELLILTPVFFLQKIISIS